MHLITYCGKRWFLAVTFFYFIFVDFTGFVVCKNPCENQTAESQIKVEFWHKYRLNVHFYIKLPRTLTASLSLEVTPVYLFPQSLLYFFFLYDKLSSWRFLSFLLELLISTWKNTPFIFTHLYIIALRCLYTAKWVA